MRKKFAVVLSLLLIPLFSFAYTNPGSPTGFVNDYAKVLSPADKANLESKLSAFNAGTGNQVAVVIIPSLGGDTIENFANKLFADWKIGNKKLDNGALILVAIQDREIRIEVGYGLEPTLTDITTSHIISDTITPEFKKGNYALGLSAGIDQIEKVIGGEPLPASSNSSNFNFQWFYYLPILLISYIALLSRSKSWWLGGVIGGFMGLIIGAAFFKTILGTIFGGIVLALLGLLLDFFVSRSYEKHKLNGTNPPWWIGGGGRGGFGGGGFGGFGGGMSGGGGSSGRW